MEFGISGKVVERRKLEKNFPFSCFLLPFLRSKALNIIVKYCDMSL